MAAVVVCGSTTDRFTESWASTALPWTCTELTDPTLTPASITSVPLAMPAALANARLNGVARAEEASIEKEDAQDAGAT